MAFFKPKLLIALTLVIASTAPSFAVDEATMTRLQELLEKAKARKSSTTLSTRDLAKPAEVKKEEVKAPTPSYQQPVINVNQNTEVNGGSGGSSEPQARSYEDILREYREKREAQKEEAKPEPVIEKPKVIAPVAKPAPTKTAEPVKAPIVKPTSPKVEKAPAPVVEKKAPAPVAEKKAPVSEEKPRTKKEKDIIKVDTKNEVKKNPLETITLPDKQQASPINSNSTLSNEEKHGTDILDKSRAVTPVNTGVAKTAADREADYQLVLRKSLKSLEDDSWNEVKYNMGEAKDYFARENTLYKDPKLDVYYKVILAFQRFSEAGLELDQGDFADFEEAEALYLDSSDILDEAEKQLTDDLGSRNIKEIINTVRKYIDEDLEYIEEMIGIE